MPHLRRSESELQQKSSDCLGDASHWHAEDLAATEWEVSELVRGFVLGLQPELVIETGCYKGQTTEAIGRALVLNRHGQCIALDTHPDYTRATRARCKDLPVIVLNEDARHWKPLSPVDLAFIDTGDPADRLADLVQLLPVLSPQAVVLFHDTGTQFGLRNKLVTWCANNHFDVILLPTPRGVGIVRKKQPAFHVE